MNSKASIEQQSSIHKETFDASKLPGLSEENYQSLRILSGRDKEDDEFAGDSENQAGYEPASLQMDEKYLEYIKKEEVEEQETDSPAYLGLLQSLEDVKDKIWPSVHIAAEENDATRDLCARVERIERMLNIKHIKSENCENELDRNCERSRSKKRRRRRKSEVRRIFPCPICDKGYGSGSAFKKHCQEDHNIPTSRVRCHTEIIEHEKKGFYHFDYTPEEIEIMRIEYLSGNCKMEEGHQSRYLERMRR